MIDRFPADFMFELLEGEEAFLRSQNATLKGISGQRSIFRIQNSVSNLLFLEVFSPHSLLLTIKSFLLGPFFHFSLFAFPPFTL